MTPIRLLREVKYFLLLGLEVPDNALQIYKKAETFRRQTGNLDLIVNIYNNMINTLLPVEEPLVSSHIDKIDAKVRTGIKVKNWNSPKIDEFIGECKIVVNDADEILTTLKTNMTNCEKILEDWRTPILDRSSNPKPVGCDQFKQEHKAVFNAKYDTVKKGGKEIHTLLKLSNKVLKVNIYIYIYIHY